eukprot:TRINITY_DN2641_c0_g1_i1.p1 TRINITY_DN2641_c0_g1~~TRINITY_DN2641_c0_g1_i1.p1  ORF type:complete len:1298 (-),score=340.82 TRINITY_DN2641_c0_g1_i1:116-4009(-)
MSKDRRILIKFENPSNRVKGLSFHPQRPWILASLHNGVIQLWDYRMEVLIDTFEEHEGPVRGICFHNTQPLFVSGGDDNKIKVWNYQKKRCLFNLLGHLDYIRTVQFHHEHPWILSASDDQTIRIWNWQSRTCIAVLTGHNHYVMCAQFHPREDLIVSASLDQTVRVWDYSGLRKRNVSIVTDNNMDYFGGTEVIVKHLLEGHLRGVNWASFHKSLPLIVSGADDHEVKLWRMSESKVTEVDSMKGHSNNVSCVLFHPKRDLIVSNSEDKTLRVWDISKLTQPQMFRRDTDRFWVLAAHPTSNLLAAGHDNGLMVFKLNRERPPFDLSTKKLYYYKEQFLYEYDLKLDKEKAILMTRRRPNGGFAGSTATPRTMFYNHFNQSQHCLLLISDDLDSKERDEGSYELYTFPKGDISRDDSYQPQRCYCRSAAFVSRNRFAVLDKNRSLCLKSIQNETKRYIQIPNVVLQAIYPAGIGRLLLRTSESMILYDIQSFQIVGEIKIPQSRYPIKYISWSGDGKYVAMWSRNNIYIASAAKFEEECTLTENCRVKSGGWDPCGVFIYTTSNHLKYLLPNGDSGILRTLDVPIYITSVASTHITYLDREVRTGRLAVDASEHLFKVALWKRRNRDVLRIMKSKKLVGQSIIAYLQKKGFPEVALHFVEDDNIKFSLALECGNIAVARECAARLDNNQAWHRLGVEALRQGNHQVVESAYQKTKNFERLSFLYLITGNMEKLAKMLQIARIRSDLLGRFHNSLYLGDVRERIAVLKDSGQLRLAYLCAKTHGLESEMKQIEDALGGESKVPVLPDLSSTARLLVPPLPLLKEANWPLLDIRKDFFEDVNNEQQLPTATTATTTTEEEKKSDSQTRLQPRMTLDDEEEQEDEKRAKDDDADEWAVDTEESEKKAKKKTDKAPKKKGTWGDEADLDIDVGEEQEKKTNKSGWADDLDIEVGEEDTQQQQKGAGGQSSSSSSSSKSGGDNEDYFVMPLSGKGFSSKWDQNSSLAADKIACGQFDTAMHILHRQIGCVNFSVLKSHFLTIFRSSRLVLPLLPGAESLYLPLARATKDLPEASIKLSHCVDLLTTAYMEFADADLVNALAHFRTILHLLPLVTLEKQTQLTEVNDLLLIAREYITAIRLDLARRESKDPIRQAALACCFTQCKIQTAHVVIGLRVAIKCTYTLKNHKTCGDLCRRLLELVVTSPNHDFVKDINVSQFKNILKACEKTNTDAADLKYSDSDPPVVCCGSLVPMANKSAKPTTCPYCQSTYSPEFARQLCANCELSQIGLSSTGLTLWNEKS